MFTCQRNDEIKAKGFSGASMLTPCSLINNPMFLTSEHRTVQPQLTLIALQGTRFKRRELPPTIECKAFLISLELEVTM